MSAGSLKVSSDALSKSWRVESSREPFYSGGKVEITSSELLVCLYNENVKVVDWKSGSVVMTSLLEESDGDISDDVVCFTVHPVKFEMVIATSAGLLRHYAQDHGNEKADARSLTMRRSMKAHALPILSMCYDPTGTLVATGSTDRTAKVWDIEKGYCTHSFRDHTESISLVRFHPDPMNLRLLTASHDCTIKCFDLVDSKCIASHGEHMSLPTAIDWASDKYLMVSVGRDKVLNFYEMRTHSHLRTVAAMDELEAVSFLPRKLATALLGLGPAAAADAADAAAAGSGSKSRKGKKKIVSVSAGDAGGEGHQSHHVIVCGGQSGLLRFYQVHYQAAPSMGKGSNTAQSFACIPLFVLAPSGQSLTCRLSLSPSLSSASPNDNDEDDGDGDDSGGSGEGEGKSRFAGSHTSIECLLVSSTHISVITADQAFITYTAAITSSGSGTTAAGLDLTLSRQLVGSHDDVIDLSLLHSSRLACVAATNSPHIHALNLSLSPPSRQSSSSTGTDTGTGTGTGTGTEVEERGGSFSASQGCQLMYGHSDVVLSVCAAPDGRYVVSCGKDQSVRVWDMCHPTSPPISSDRKNDDGDRTSNNNNNNGDSDHDTAGGGGGEVVGCYPVCIGVGSGHTEGVGCVVLSSRQRSYDEGRAAAYSASGDKILKRWDLHSLLKQVKGSSSSGGCGGSSMYRGGTERRVRTVEGVGGVRLSADFTALAPQSTLVMLCTHSVRAHDKDINCTTIAPNDAIIATGSQDKLLKLWRADTLAPIATLRGHRRGVWKAQFSPVDKALISSSADRTLRLWSMADFSCLRSFEGNTASVLTVHFLSRGMQVLSGSADGLVRLWNVGTGECVATFDEHQDKVWALTLPSESHLHILPHTPTATASPTPTDSGNEEPRVGVFVSAGSDSCIRVWGDRTRELERLRLQEQEDALANAQALDNDVNNRRYGKALALALKLGYSRRLLTILTCILEEEGEEAQAAVPVATASDRSSSAAAERQAGKLDAFVGEWSDEELDKVCAYLLDWNTNARYAHTSQCLFSSLLKVKGAQVLKRVPALQESCTALAAYSERHLLRISKLHQASFVLDFMVAQMTMLPSELTEDDIAAADAENRKNRFLLDRAEQARAERMEQEKRDKGKNEGATSEVEDDTLVLFRGGASAYNQSETDSSDSEDEADAVAEEEEGSKGNSKGKGKVKKQTLVEGAEKRGALAGKKRKSGGVGASKKGKAASIGTSKKGRRA